LQSLNIDAPLIGFLTSSTLLSPGAAVSVAGWAKAIAEPEIAVYMGEDLSGDVDRDTARAAVAAIGPAIELADVIFTPNDVEEILVSNIFNRHIILGEKDSSRAGLVLDGLVSNIYKGDEQIAETSDPQANTGDLVDIVRHLASLLPRFGEGLRAGDLIITGSVVPPISIVGTENIRYSLDPMGTVSINSE
jgi:2-keto-4-pentenoate hydratase